MKITSVEVYFLSAPQPEREFWLSLRPVLSVNELVVKIMTDEGITGVGLGTASGRVSEVAEIFKRGFGDLILGEDPLRPERVLKKTLGTTYHRISHDSGWPRDHIITAAATIDNALWDIMGKAAGLPLYKLLGGLEGRARTYAGGGYYRDGKDVAELVDEVGRYYEMGHRGFKMKIGAMTLEEDMSRVAGVRKAIGPECLLAVDVNGAWDYAAAKEGVQHLTDFDLAWIEEPICWREAKHTLPRLKADCPIPIADGHGEMNLYDCLRLIDDNSVDIIQFDATKFEGVTGSRKIMTAAELAHIQFMPHHDPQIHAHCIAASPAGYICESHADPERDPVWFELFDGTPELKEGWLTLSDRPGFGVELNEAAMNKWAERVC
ncbi:MAG: mandelate racemase/muconate lactonizing enzyme family protein [Nitrospinaceae bacterium]|jgi:L-alanine-DL-glutamate epimerase-like enolase superfamily enzyme|nr:mandelate racemase/muconate lactonizing enzyme family protein [Nitrospinaceae bacterium]MBT3434468.1 mandelate racemase/muconate lactonizing enzyme family protein [Nitrospinaceae bacterium]MBT3822504.1 mandelate racemase/muconate lactonizing enzyme family protein [Nitrospinaceae bacterium]MBT4430972.1 mandelate racemase/muconate lactonizing enzyme family protein [Nitrospinaceae bacterium]MBT5369416.1 mandelate racemase/muconate lactonizing enzyme family protein [Nitrospinaceae bacterium]